ncbi:MAG: fused MFS/spermidine synthase [Planctomycetes bacterium]|nr:fused MFS/spermidine synthase [Planctomycetota bacterium]
MACTIFLGAFLLFQVQPIMGKYVLPWFGGSPGVWTTCMLVFQVLLFGGYAYAHLLSSFFHLRAQTAIHACLLILAACTLPITPDVSWKPTGSESPSLAIILLLVAKVGFPYFMLSSTGPLLQSWLGQTRCVEQPYRLYSLSNLGSLLALLSFPFIVEPNLSSYHQSLVWSACFVFYVILCSVICFLIALSRRLRAENSAVATKFNAHSHAPMSVQAGWFAFATIASVLLLATTNQVCLDTAVIPFLWILPLAIYLLTFIITFEHEGWYLRRPYIMLASVCFIALSVIKGFHLEVDLRIEIAAYFSSLFFSCMVCHGELYRSRPDTNELTRFYITIAAGGAFGGILVGIIAPMLFRTFLEWQIGLLCVIAVFVCTYLNEMNWQERFSRPFRVAAVSVVACIAVVAVSFSSQQPGTLARTRNFFGVLSVLEASDEKTREPVRNLVHGTIVHGSQFLDPNLRRVPTTYYSRTSGIGQLLQSMDQEHRKIGVVGLGAGTLATYGREGDTIRFYEINPDVIDLASRYFDFLTTSDAKIETVVGDARLVMDRERDQDFDCLVLDAFSGDAIPVHLLTSEAMLIYRRHLKKHGVLAIHISNLYFDLRPIVEGLANHAGMKVKIIANNRCDDNSKASTWAILSRDNAALAEIDSPSDMAPVELIPKRSKLVIWTDERSNLLEVLR